MVIGKIYSVHGYYGKLNSRKGHQKLEAIVYARTASQAESIVRKLFDRYPAEIEYLHVIGLRTESDERFYDDRTELEEVNPDDGFIYDEFIHRSMIDRYFK